MNRTLFASAIVALALGTGAAVAADPTPAKDSPAASQTTGRDMMTPAERAEHRKKMRSAKSAEERQKLRSEHHEEMMERAHEQGKTVPCENTGTSGTAAPCGMGQGMGGPGRK